MKSTHCSIRTKAIGVLLSMAATGGAAYACGPYNPIIPTPPYFSSSDDSKQRSDFNDDENLLVWQRQTSPDIPLDQIAEAVYKADIDRIYDGSYDNTFLNYLRNTNDQETFDFLYAAKTVQKLREKHTDAWYYPSSRKAQRFEFDEIISTMRSYDGERYRDRYGLQLVRAYFAAGSFRECVEYYDSVFRRFPADNLFRRMADNYVAGCWMHLGDTVRANEFFLKSGDMQSLRVDNPELTMARYNPDCPELLNRLHKCAGDSAKFARLLPAAEAALANPKLINRGDWEFYMAYLNGEYLHDPVKAGRYISRALTHRFSSADLRDHARAYRMLTDARRGDESHLLADLLWIESKMDLTRADACQWNRLLKNVVFTGWVPVLWQKGKYSKAILLCGYADNLYASQRKVNYWLDSRSYTLDQARYLPELYNPQDYANLSFQLMASLKSEQLIKAQKEFKSGNALYRHLRRYARTDADYVNELIGTLALREEEYDRAASFLARVSHDYQQCMNIYRDGYLEEDPFAHSPFDLVAKPAATQLDAKLRFARGMAALKRQMEHGATADERGLAALRYAIALRNSFDRCWALTQYWQGNVPNRFVARLQYWDEDTYRPLAFLDDSEPHRFNVERRYRRQVDKALATLATDEARAEAQLILGNRRKVVREYGLTQAAAFVKTHCDHWRDWL